MASEPVTIGELFDAHGDPFDIRLWPRGAVEVRDRIGDYTRLVLDAEGCDKLRELLDRAAMPGQSTAPGQREPVRLLPDAGARNE